MGIVTVSQTEFQEISIESAAPGELTELGTDALDECAGGASAFEATNSGFSGKKLSMGQMTFAGPEGAGTTSFMDSTEISSFANRLFGVSQ
jgi:hypothetical protein